VRLSPGKDRAATIWFAASAAPIYASGQEAVTHIGLGAFDRCDIKVTLPCGKGRIEQRGITADQRIVLTR